MKNQKIDYDFCGDKCPGGIKVVGKEGKFGYINRKGVEITPLKYDSVKDFYNSAGWVQLDGKWGMVNRQGVEVVTPVYDEVIICNIIDRPDIVRLGNKYGYFCTETVEPVTPIKYDYAKLWNWTTKLENVVAPVQIDNKWGCINLQGKEIIPLKHEEIEINERFITVKLNEKWGCFNLQGKEIIPQEYEEIKIRDRFFAAKLNGKWGFFNENVTKTTGFEYDEYDFSWMYYGDKVRVCKDGKYGLVSCGVEITSPKYDQIVVYMGQSIMQLDGKYGMLNPDGKEIIPPVYDELAGLGFHSNITAKLGDKYGLISPRSGKLITPVQYDEIDTMQMRSVDLAIVRIGDKWGVITINGKEILSLKYGEISIIQFDTPSIAAKLDGKWGGFDVRGKEIIPQKYEAIYRNEGYTVLKFDGKWGFVDKKGKEITDFEFDDVDRFNYGLARIKKDGKYGFIDAKFNIVIPCEYDDCDDYFDKVVSPGKRFLPLWVKRDGKYGFIDTKGKWKIKPKFEYAKPFICVEKNKYFAAVVMNGKVGFINETGKIVIPCMYEPDFSKGNYYFDCQNVCNVKYDGKWGVIDAQNQIVIPFLYDEFLHNIRNGTFLYAMRDGKKLSIDAKGNVYDFTKNRDARTFKDYVHAVEWAAVAESAETLDIDILEENFHNFRSKQHKPSNDIIRIFSNDDRPEWDNSLVAACMFSVEDECSYGFFDWAEILDMEVRIEDNLTLSDADVVAICMYEACDRVPITEKSIIKSLDRLQERCEVVY